jgi:glycosyltransferase involved in cell wall biosynthesis
MDTVQISVIVTTYNWPEALAACLYSLFDQEDQQFEILIADDGSAAATQQLIAELSTLSPITIRHIYHADEGFRAATIRNKAVAASHGKYLVFLDGDCLVFPHFISRHRQLAEAGYFVPGNRILLSASFTPQLLQQKLALPQQSLVFFIRQRLKGHINRLLPLVYLPFNAFRYGQPQNWQKAMTCNLGVWKQDFLTINGFDEIFQGWGYEDSDLVIRLIHQGVLRKEGRFALAVLHLWHQLHDRSQHDANYERLLERLADKSLIQAKMGVAQYY